MKFAATLLIAASSAILASAPAFAATSSRAKSNNDPGFNVLDRNHDGYLSRSEAARNPYLAKRFKKADRNGDGKLSRTEYLAVMTKKDLTALKDKIIGGKKQSTASAGGTSSKSSKSK